MSLGNWIFWEVLWERPEASCWKRHWTPQIRAPRLCCGIRRDRSVSSNVMRQWVHCRGPKKAQIRGVCEVLESLFQVTLVFPTEKFGHGPPQYILVATSLLNRLMPRGDREDWGQSPGPDIWRAVSSRSRGRELSGNAVAVHVVDAIKMWRSS